VQNHLLDLDEDDIWDNVDSISMNNYVSAVLLGMMSTPIVEYAGSVLGRSLEKKTRLTRKNKTSPYISVSIVFMMEAYGSHPTRKKDLQHYTFGSTV